MATLSPKKLGLGLYLCFFLSTPRATAADEARFLPFMGARLEAARYAPANEEFSWVGWIGATVDLVEKGKWSGYFDPNVETILGHRVRSFEAVQGNYSLEGGIRRDTGRGRLTTFFHHISRHVEDREKIHVVDWNFLGVAYDSPWPSAWERRGGYRASVGFTALTSGVQYNAEVRAAMDIDVVRQDNKGIFALMDVRYVSATPSPGFARGSFADFRAEGGVRRFQASSQFALFVAYEHRNDALISNSLVINRALFGFRIHSERRSAPTTPPIP